MMKVLSIGSDRSLFVNGSAAQKRIKEYGKLFDELHIVVFSTRNYQLPIANYQANIKLQIGENIWVYPTNSGSKLLYLLDAYKIGKNIIRNWKLEIRNYAISAQDPFESGLIGWLLKLRHRKSLKLQLQVHTDVFSPYFGAESFQNKVRVILARFLLPKADGIRVVSERIKQSLVSGAKCKVSKITVLPILTDVKKIQAMKIKTDLRKEFPNKEFIILMASRLTKEKNIPIAIEAIAKLANSQFSIPSYLLLIVGDGPEKPNLESLIIKKNLGDNVVIRAWTEDLASFYKTADLFLLTSNYEGYGRTVAEAMALGLPTIMTDVGLAGEILIDDLDGKIIPVGSAKELAKAIMEVLSHREKLEEFKINMEKVVSNFPTKEAYLSEYRKALESLL